MEPPDIVASILKPHLSCGKSEKLNAVKTAYCIPVIRKCITYSNSVENPVFSGFFASAAKILFKSLFIVHTFDGGAESVLHFVLHDFILYDIFVYFIALQYYI